MNIDIILTPKEAELSRISGNTVAVIDVFRATSCICTAMESGAKRLIPLANIDTSVELRNRLVAEGVGSVLLGGERKMLKIEGFDLDNSPLSYRSQIVRGATIVMCTTNGTRSIELATSSSAHSVFVASLLNAKAAAEKLWEQGRDIVLFCSGRADRFSVEDTLCAGYIVSLLNERHTVELSEVAWWAMDVYERYKENLRGAMQYNRHYHTLLSLGMADDIEYCLTRDMFTTVPYLNNGVVEL